MSVITLNGCHAPLKVANRTHGTTPSRHTAGLRPLGNTRRARSSSRGAGSTVGRGYDSTGGLSLTGPVGPAPGQARPGGAARSTVADLAVQLGQRAGVVHHDGGDAPAAAPGWPGPPSGPWPGPWSCRGAGPADPAAAAAARPPPRPGRSCPPCCSRRSAARRAPRSRRGRRLLQLAHPLADQGVHDRVQPDAQRRVGEHDLAQPGPVQPAVGRSTSGPNAATTSASPGVPGSTTSLAMASASITTAPCAASRRETSLLPAPIPPVRPTRHNSRRQS